MWWRKAFHQWPGPLESQNQKHHSAVSVSGRIKGKKNTQGASGEENCVTGRYRQKSEFFLLFLLYLLNYAPQACTPLQLFNLEENTI